MEGMELDKQKCRETAQYYDAVRPGFVRGVWASFKTLDTTIMIWKWYSSLIITISPADAVATMFAVLSQVKPTLMQRLMILK